MANKLFPKFKEALLAGNANLAGTVRAVLVDTGGYTQSDAHEFLSAVPAAARIGTPQTLGTKTYTGGVFDAADLRFPNVPKAADGTSASAAEALVIYIDTGDATTSRLVAFIDTATGLPVSPNGGNIDITWDAYVFSI